MTDTKSDTKAGRFDALLRLLAKLGVFRSGIKSYTYTSGRDRPAESLMPDVFNAERDLTTADDVRKLLKRAPKTPKNGG